MSTVNHLCVYGILFAMYILSVIFSLFNNPVTKFSNKIWQYYYKIVFSFDFFYPSVFGDNLGLFLFSKDYELLNHIRGSKCEI